MMKAQVLLQAKEIKIEAAELALATERQRVAIYQDERDRAVGARFACAVGGECRVHVRELVLQSRDSPSSGVPACSPNCRAAGPPDVAITA
jgi:hypothetical protein